MKKVLFFCFVLFATAAYGQEIPSAAEIIKQSNEELSAQYAEKPLVVNGIIAYSGPSTYGLPSLRLYATEEAKGEYISCVLPCSDYFKLGDLKIGQKVIVSGEFRTKHQDGFILLKQSAVLEVIE